MDRTARLRDTGQAMSSENVEIVRRSLDAYARRDEAALRELVDVDFELDWTRSIGWLTGVYRGIDETLRFYAGYFEAFREIVVKPDCFIHAGDLVVVPNEARQWGRDGIEVTARSCLVFTVRSGKLLRICLYQDTEEALEAAGLAQQAIPQEHPGDV
jgi:ketosteroid isomerase-like protein